MYVIMLNVTTLKSLPFVREGCVPYQIHTLRMLASRIQVHTHHSFHLSSSRSPHRYSNGRSCHLKPQSHNCISNILENCLLIV